MYGFDEYELYINEYSIEDVREDLSRIVKFFRDKEYHKHAMELFFEYRDLPVEISDECDAFCVDEELTLFEIPEWMKADSLGFVKKEWIPMWGRCVFPVKDVKGNVMGFCGWDPFVTPKYLDSKNYGYKAKSTTLFGMEKLPEYYVNKKPIFITEGLMCTLYLRYKGFCAMSSLGSYLTPYVIQILSRFGNRLVVIPDNDETGDKFVKQVKRVLPKALCVQVKYGKDIDGCRRFENGIYEEQLIKELTSLSNPFSRTELLIRR